MGISYSLDQLYVSIKEEIFFISFTGNQDSSDLHQNELITQLKNRSPCYIKVRCIKLAEELYGLKHDIAHLHIPYVLVNIVQNLFAV